MGLILIDKNGLCFCSCATKCVIGRRSGMEKRCSAEAIQEKGFSVIQVADNDSHVAVMDTMVIDGKTHRINVKYVRL
jgi:hypothetical protein